MSSIIKWQITCRATTNELDRFDSRSHLSGCSRWLVFNRKTLRDRGIMGDSDLNEGSTSPCPESKFARSLPVRLNDMGVLIRKSFTIIRHISFASEAKRIDGPGGDSLARQCTPVCNSEDDEERGDHLSISAVRRWRCVGEKVKTAHT